MPKHFAIRLSLLVFVICLLSCGTVRVYKEPDKPVFYSNEKRSQSIQQADSLNVVTFNIEEAEKIQLAISELQQFEKTRKIDVYLLQEMDEKGVEEIAKVFSLNYLYIPIVYNKLIKKNIGNAILTKGTIEHPEKLILPHSKWVNKRRRHVTIGEVNIHQKKILVYSVHTETVMMSRKHRMDQIDAIIEHAKMQLPNYNYVLIGGDFNTLCSKDSQLAVEKFNSNGFDWPTAAAGSTARAFFGLMKPTHDYLFSRGLKAMSSCKIEASKSSDHYPVFATFRY
jgi:endonuclease/exonuclease/phosphatase family metal-dependent hydrolase